MLWRGSGRIFQDSFDVFEVNHGFVHLQCACGFASQGTRSEWCLRGRGVQPQGEAHRTTKSRTPTSFSAHSTSELRLLHGHQHRPCTRNRLQGNTTAPTLLGEVAGFTKPTTATNGKCELVSCRVPCLPAPLLLPAGADGFFALSSSCLHHFALHRLSDACTVSTTGRTLACREHRATGMLPNPQMRVCRGSPSTCRQRRNGMPGHHT